MNKLEKIDSIIRIMMIVATMVLIVTMTITGVNYIRLGQIVMGIAWISLPVNLVLSITTNIIDYLMEMKK